VNIRAFDQVQEADIVDRLRENADWVLSLVAVRDEAVVGHILFSPATIEGQHGILKGTGLAPIAVLPDFQKQGIGSLLVRGGLNRLRKTSCPFVIVLGHPGYYQRFGFASASRFGIQCQWGGVPDEAFMILWLDPALDNKVKGMAMYREEFNEAV